MSMYISKYVSEDVEVELETDDIMEYIDSADDDELRDFKERILDLLDDGDDTISFADVKEFIEEDATLANLKRLKAFIEKRIKEKGKK